jgi:hypothetical protein
MSNKELLDAAIEHMVDGDMIKFNSVISTILQSKVADAVEAAKEVVADQMYNFDEEEVDEEEIDESERAPLRLIKTHTSTDGNRIAKVFKGDDEDFHTQHFKDGKHIKKLDAHTDYENDAHASAKTFIGIKEAAEDVKVDEDDFETVNEQSHKIEAVYTSKDGTKKKSVLRVSADSKSKAKNKVGVHLSQMGHNVHSLTHVEAVDIKGDEIEEGKTYRNDSDNSFSSKVKNNIKKKADKAAKDKASEKRSVED